MDSSLQSENKGTSHIDFDKTLGQLIQLHEHYHSKALDNIHKAKEKQKEYFDARHDSHKVNKNKIMIQFVNQLFFTFHRHRNHGGAQPPLLERSCEFQRRLVTFIHCTTNVRLYLQMSETDQILTKMVSSLQTRNSYL